MRWWTTATIAAWASTLAMPALAACQVETRELPVQMVGSRATATVRINGTPIPMMVDSGAFFSILTEATADQLHLVTKRNNALRVEGITGRVDTRVTTVDQLQLFKGTVEHVDFVVGGNDPGAGTMGIIGRNILAFTDTEYDLAHGVIRFLFPTADCAKANMAYWAGTTPVTEVDLESELRDKTPAIRAEVRLNDAKVMALFDTGATTLVSAQAARRADVPESDWKRAGTVFGGGRGRAEAYIAPFDRFSIGGETIRNNHLRVANFDLGREADMLLGIDFFLSHRIYVSKQQSKIFITYNGGPVFAPGGAPSPAQEAAKEVAKEADAASPASAAEALSADDLARRGAASASRREYDSALADLDRACALVPTSAAFLAQRGAIHEALRHPAKAREDFDRALELDPQQTDARFRRVVLRLAARDRDGAKADLDVLDRALAPQAQMRLPMSQLYLTLDQPARAIAQLDQWLPAHPSEVQRDVAYNNRCWARVLANADVDKAVDDCDEAIGIDDRNAAYFDSRGWAYLRLGKERKAVADFDRCIALRPASPVAFYGRGIAKTRMGDRSGGDADLAAARKLQPDIDANLARRGLALGASPMP